MVFQMVADTVLPDCPDDTTREILQNRQLANQIIKDNLTKAQTRIKYHADISLGRKESLKLGTWST